jgi:hypothetical protein
VKKLPLAHVAKRQADQRDRERRRRLIVQMRAEGQSQPEIGAALRLRQQRVSEFLNMPASKAELPVLRAKYLADLQTIMPGIIAKMPPSTDPEPAPAPKPAPCRACQQRPPEVDPSKPLSAAARRLWEKKRRLLAHTCCGVEDPTFVTTAPDAALSDTRPLSEILTAVQPQTHERAQQDEAASASTHPSHSPASRVLVAPTGGLFSKSIKFYVPEPGPSPLYA